MKAIVNWATFDPANPINFEAPTSLPSMTVPGQTLGLVELLRRYVRGDNVTVLPGQFTGEDTDIPDDLERLDTVERARLAQGIRESISDFQHRSRARQKPGTPAKEGEGTKPPGEGVGGSGSPRQLPPE